MLCATLLLDPEFESLLLLHELAVGLVNTLTVTLEKLSEILVLSGMSGLIFVFPTSESHLKVVTDFCVLDV